MLGNVATHVLPSIPAARWLILALIASLLAAIWRGRYWPLGFVLALVWTCCVAQFALDVRLPEAFDRHDIRLSGWVDDFSRTTSRRTQFSLSIDTADIPMLAGARVRLSWYEPEFAVQPGQQLSLTARLRMPRGLVNPAGFDYERWLMLEGFAATGYVRELHDRGERREGFAPWLLTLRAGVRERIAARLAATPGRGLITALTIGERSEFSDQHWKTFRRTGTSHLVAISGLHIGIVAFVMLWPAKRMFRLLGRWFAERANSAATLAALSAAVCYSGLAGFSIATLRAVLMLAAALLVAGTLRKVSRFYALAAAAVLLTAIDPLATLQTSFWLSFGAVGTLLLAFGPDRVALHQRGAQRGWHTAVRMQLAVALMAVPVGAVFFGEFSTLALVVNLVAIPLFSLVVVPLVLFCVFFDLFIDSFFGSPGWLWAGVGWLADSVMSTLEMTATIPFASIAVATPGLFTAVLAIAGVVLMLPWHPQRARGIGVFALIPLVWPRSELLPPQAFRVTVLDVGHGLATLVETRNYLLVYDAGARFDSGYDTGSNIVLPVLRNTRAPNTMIISHGDNDHSGGAAAIVAEYPDIAVLTGPDVSFGNSRFCAAGQSWTRDGVEFELLHPSEDFGFPGNNSSCVLRVSGAGGAVLFTGDIERAGEAALLGNSSIDADIVIAPHHGSETSSTPPLVAATSPAVAIFSAAYRNRWNFPREIVVNRWCAVGADIYVTGDQGAIEVTVGDGPTRVAALRGSAPRYWRPNSEPRCGESPGVTL